MPCPYNIYSLVKANWYKVWVWKSYIMLSFRLLAFAIQPYLGKYQRLDYLEERRGLETLGIMYVWLTLGITEH
jgi:heme exporter protein D